MKLSCAQRLSAARRPRVLCAFFAASVLIGCAASATAPAKMPLQTHWVATWTASPQPIWGADFSFPTNIPDHLQDQTIRQVARLSLGGQRVRLVLFNAYGNTPLYVGAVSVAISAERSALKASTLRAVTFSGHSSATIPPGAPLLSDPIDMEVSSLSRLTISIYLPQNTPTATFHWDGRQTAWITDGDQTAVVTIDPHARSTEIVTTRTVLTGIDVLSRNSGARAVAVIGDSTTDGNGVTINSDASWLDFLAERLAPHGVAVINAGISVRF